MAIVQAECTPRPRWAHGAAAMAASVWLAAATSGQVPGGVVLAFDEAWGQGQAAPADARSAAEALVASMGWVEGVNDLDGARVHVVIASRAIPASTGGVGFARRRTAAFRGAMLDARAALAEQLSTEIETRLRRLIAEGAGTAAAAESAVIDSELLGDEGWSWLAARGSLVASDESEGGPQALEITDAMVKTATRAVIGGVQAFRTFEAVAPDGEGAIAVVATWSPRGRALQRALLGLDEVPRGVPELDLALWAASLDPQELLLYSFGAQPRLDQHGELAIVAFGQAEALFPGEAALDRAATRARLAAMEELRRFLGSEIVAERALREIASLVVGLGGSRVDTGGALVEEIDDRGAALRLSGVSMLRRWTATHPRGGLPTVGVVLKLSASDAIRAAMLRDDPAPQPSTGDARHDRPRFDGSAASEGVAGQAP
jgi:hypothetical protein